MHHPPRFLLRFFRWYCHPKLKKYIEGDLMELYGERFTQSGKRKADFGFAVDVLLLFRPGIIHPAEENYQLNQYSMFKNYFKVGIRNILKYKVFSFINVFGLAVAMSVCMLIILMLADQHRYDQFNQKKDRIYRILSSAEGSRQAYATTPFPLANALKSDYPIIEQSTTLMPEVGGDATYGQRTVVMRGYFASPSFFNIFDFETELGDKNTALTAPNSMIISSTLSKRLFGDENPLGKVVEFSDRQLPFPIDHDGVGGTTVPWGSFTVTGVIDESKYKSHLHFDVLVSTSSREALYATGKMKDPANDWEWYFRHYTYVLLAPGSDREDLSAALNDLVTHRYANSTAEYTKGFKLEAQELTAVQLDLMGNDTDNRFPRIGYYFLTFLAGIIMILACLNYTNLSVARALTRAREIGVRKVTGANKSALIFQFLTESVLTAMAALAMATAMLFLLKPAFKNLWINQYLNFELPAMPSVYFVFFGFALLIGVIAGLYPAFHLSTYQPIKALKDLSGMKPGKLGLRKVLSVVQFVVSLFFIVTSTLIYNQFEYFLKFDYGFTSANIVNVELQGVDYRKLKNEFSSVPGVTAISAADIIPATGRSNGVQLKKVNSADEFVDGHILNVDENFLDNLDLKLIAGKNLPPPVDSAGVSVIVNETALKKLGYTNPHEIVGQVLETKWSTSMKVTGVVSDFQYNALINTHAVGPLVLANNADQYIYLNIKLNSPDVMATVSRLEEKWKQIDPVHPFKYGFFDEQLQSTQRGIFDLVAILGFIAFLAITIACLGLLGMATYAAERKTKEVGIRKVLGAPEWSIALLLSKEFLKILGITIAVGAPLSYFVNNLWLQTLPNRVEFGWATVLTGTLVLLVLGSITIVSQTLAASKRNPVEALKTE